MLNKDDEIEPYFEHKMPLLRIHSVSNGMCGCGNLDCKSQGKHPAEPKGVHSAKAETSAKRFERFNVGVACGEGFAVLDIDPRNGGDASLSALIAKHGELPATWKVATGGGGTHYYFRIDGTQKTGKNLTGIELMGKGNYVICPGSIHRSGHSYEWEVHPSECKMAPLPEWVRAACVSDGIKHEEGEIEEPELYSQEEVLSMLKAIDPSCPRETWWRVGAGLKTAGFPVEMWDEWSRGSKKYIAKEIKTEWDSYKIGMIKFGTVKHFAEQYGWKPESVEKWDFAKAIEIESIPEKRVELDIPSPPGGIDLLAKEILAHAVNKSKRFSLVSALSIAAPIVQGCQLTPEYGVLGLYFGIVTKAGKGKSDYVGPVDSTLEAVEKVLDFPEESLRLRIPRSAHYIKNTLNRLPCTTFIHDEGLAWFRKTMTNPSENNDEICQDLLSAWSGNKLQGFGTKDELNSTKAVKDPRLSVLFAGTHEVVESLFMEGSALSGGGMLSRMDFILSEVVTDEEKERTGPFKPSKELLSALRKPLSGIIYKKTVDAAKVDEKKGEKIGSAQDVLTVLKRKVLKWGNPEVRARWKAIEKECKRLEETTEHGPTVWSRCAEKILRIASIVAIFDNGEIVNMEHLEWAIFFQMASTRDMQLLCDDYLGKSLETQCREKLIEAASRAGGRISLGRVQRHWQKFKNVPQDTVRRALERLEAEGVIEPCQKTKRGAVLLILKALG